MLLTENSNQWTGVHSGRQTTGNVPFPTEVQHNRDLKKKKWCHSAYLTHIRSEVLTTVPSLPPDVPQAALDIQPRDKETLPETK